MMNYSIKDVAERFQLSAYTLRYYEREGLIPPVQRMANGIRTYCENDLEWIELIKCLRATGMSISDIKAFVKLCNLGGDTLEERQRVIVKQKEIIERHIQEY